MLADTSSKSQTHIRVNINLADCTLSSLSQLILWDTDSILQVTTVCIDNLNILRYNRGCTMENDWEVWQSLLNLCQNIKPQLWWNQYTISISGALSWGEFESTMAGTYCNSKRVYASAGNEFLYLIRLGVSSILSIYVNIILDASQLAKLTFNNYAMLMGIFYNLPGQLNILLKGISRSINHYRSEATIDAALAGLEIRTVIEMHCDRNINYLNSSLNEMHEVLMLSVFSSTSRGLENNRRI